MPRRRRKKRGTRWKTALAIVFTAVIVSVAAGVLLLTQSQDETRITELIMNNVDCGVENCTVESGAFMLLSVGIQSSKTIENVEVHVWAIWSQRRKNYQIDESRIVRLEPGEHRVENFKTTAYCSSCAGTEPGPYAMFAEISVDNEVLDNFETTIYLVEWTWITELAVDNADCEVENCTVESGTSMVISVGIQAPGPIDVEAHVRVRTIWSQRRENYQIDESRIVRLEPLEHRVENFKTTAYCSSCAGIKPGPYAMLAEISVDNEVLDNYETTIYLVE